MSGSVVVKPRLSRQFFFIVLGILVAVFTVIYFYSVPLIKKQVFEIERNSSRLALNNVFEIASRMYDNVEDYRTQSLQARKQQLQAVVELAESYLQESLQQAQQQGTSLPQARTQALQLLQKLRYGEQGYLWVVDHQGQLLVHPDERYQSSSQRLPAGNADVLPEIVQQAISEGAGFYEYQWHRPGEQVRLDKLAYVKNYPQWGLVIGSGLYLDDLDQEIAQRKQLAIQELRSALQDIRVAKTGYLFIFDNENQMLIHPNRNIDGTNIRDLINPLSQNYIAEDLVRVADTGQELHYLWDKPEDPGRYVYEKLSLVRYLKGFDWYICSSVYLEELVRSSETLSTRLMTLAGLTFLVSLGLAWFFIQRVTRPLVRLSETARRVSAGDLSAQSGIHNQDEIGVLAHSFDGMVRRLKSNIDTLDSEVRQRTDELLETNARAQRMHAVGQLAGGLAHDFNNLLSIILGNLLLARDRHAQAEDGLGALLEPAIRATRRGADITQRLLAFSRRQPLEPEVVSLNDLLQDTVKLLRGSLPENIQLDCRMLAEGEVHVDPGHLENALINLALNARDAMPEGGVLCFMTEQVQPPDSGFDEAVPPGHYVQLQVCDTGTGFSENACFHAFEPFFTTKSTGFNSGLGLSMVYGFVKQSRGYIRIQNRQSPASGACITILLPLAQTAGKGAEKTVDVVPVSDELQGRLWLLVEDNEDLRILVREQLLQLGVYVVEAGEGQEAEELIDSLDELDGMLTDVMLPGRSGWQLAERLRHKNPHSVIVLMSGYADEADRQAAEAPRFPLLRKPFDQVELARVLWRAVHAERGPLPGQREEESG
ncbi:MAG: cache domain-containing protein [Thiolinea sp.]